jgi:hypothetical protein
MSALCTDMTNTIDHSKVHNAATSFRSFERTLAEGSDEQLDLILDLQSDIVKCINKTVELNSWLEESFNSFNQEEAKKVILEVSDALRTAHQIVILSRKVPRAIADGLKTKVSEFSLELRDTREFLDDLHRYKLNANPDLVDLVTKAGE